jgi:hypothetical protein
MVDDVVVDKLPTSMMGRGAQCNAVDLRKIPLTG